MDLVQTFTSTPSAVAEVRGFVRSALGTAITTDHLDLTLLLADELAANAVLHARTPFMVRVRMADHIIEVEVTDRDQRLPLPPPLDIERLDGRGLLLVSTLAHAWGVRPRPNGKTVWFQIAAPTTA